MILEKGESVKQEVRQLPRIEEMGAQPDFVVSTKCCNSTVGNEPLDPQHDHDAVKQGHE